MSDADECVHATLISPEIELATSDDLLLAPAVTGLTYPLLAHGDILGYLAPTQLTYHISTVNPAILITLTNLRNDEPVNQAPDGPPLTTHTDPRWVFKLAELRRLQHLAPRSE